MPGPTDTRYGFPLSEWKAAVERVAAALTEAARRRQTVTYGELCHHVGSPRLFPRSWALLALVDEACDDDTVSRGAHLASLLVRASDGMPGEGYFRWAERAGFDVRDRRAFWEAETQRAYAAWQDERTVA